MDLFLFFLGVFTVLFIISFVLSYINFFNVLKVKGDINNTKRSLENHIDDVESDLVISLDRSTRDIYAIIAKIENQLDDIIARLEEVEKK